MRSLISLIPWLLMLWSCSSPPKPPTVDESLKRPANSAQAVELQACRHDLQNTRIQSNEAGRRADAAAASLEQLAARQKVLAAMQAPPPPTPQANSIFAVRFDFNSARVAIAPDTASALIEDARSAPLVLLRGRTDGATDSAAESRIARERAAAVRDYLVAAGIDPARIRATYQPAGDHAADNSSPAGRDINRRVEIEVYRAPPIAMHSAAVALHSPADR
jgi:outer membrane protein OmpA-like peptidoglycan-associated protein